MSPTDEEQLAILEQARDARLQRVLAMTPAERFALMDALCREFTWLEANARRAG